MSESYDVVVIGAGCAGYVAAARCAQLGLKTACVDEWVDESGKHVLGGTAVHAGCYASKSLLSSSQFYRNIVSSSDHYGVQISDVALNLEKMHMRTKGIINALAGDIENLFKARGVVWKKGHGQMQPGLKVEISDVEGNSIETVEAKNVILATGSKPLELHAVPVDNEFIVDSSGALKFEEVPKRIGIMGAGVVGVEIGSIWSRLGAEVQLFDAQHRVLPMADPDIGEEALKVFGGQGLHIHLETRVVSAKVQDGQVVVEYQNEKGTHTETFDKLVVCAGRVPYTHGLISEDFGMELEEGGFIGVDEECQTTTENVYAIGDVVRGPMLAHKGMKEGLMVAAKIAGGDMPVHYSTIPAVIYTNPEVAWIGKNEEELQQEGVEVNIGKIPYSSNMRVRGTQGEVGFVKIIADAKTDKILGVHMLGRQCSELINQASIAMEFGATSEDLALTIFAHPTISEVMSEASLAVTGSPLLVP